MKITLNGFFSEAIRERYEKSSWYATRDIQSFRKEYKEMSRSMLKDILAILLGGYVAK